MMSFSLIVSIDATSSSVWITQCKNFEINILQNGVCLAITDKSIIWCKNNYDAKIISPLLTKTINYLKKTPSSLIDLKFIKCSTPCESTEVNWSTMSYVDQFTLIPNEHLIILEMFMMLD